MKKATFLIMVCGLYSGLQAATQTTSGDFSPVIEYLVGVVKDNEPLERYLHPLKLTNIHAGLVTISSLQVDGLSNISPATKIELSFDGARVQINGILSVRGLQYYLQLVGPFWWAQSLSGGAQQVSLAMEVVLPVTGHPHLSVFRLAALSGLRITTGSGVIRFLSGITRMDQAVVGIVNKQGKDTLQKMLGRFRFPNPPMTCTG